jgi:hypothetical protein
VVPPFDGADTLYVIDTLVGLVLVALIETLGGDAGGALVVPEVEFDAYLKILLVS